MVKYEVIISRFAEDDLQELIMYFYDINIEYAKNIYNKLKEKINDLKIFPKKGKIVPELEKQGIIKYRQVIVDYYRIIYSVTDNKINILMIVDSRRNLEELLMKKLIGMFEAR
jgi:plasmid stabilization system protein ParE